MLRYISYSILGGMVVWAWAYCWYWRGRYVERREARATAVDAFRDMFSSGNIASGAYFRYWRDRYVEQLEARAVIEHAGRAWRNVPDEEKLVIAELERIYSCESHQPPL